VIAAVRAFAEAFAGIAAGSTVAVSRPGDGFDTAEIGHVPEIEAFAWASKDTAAQSPAAAAAGIHLAAAAAHKGIGRLRRPAAASCIVDPWWDLFRASAITRRRCLGEPLWPDAGVVKVKTCNGSRDEQSRSRYQVPLAGWRASRQPLKLRGALTRLHRGIFHMNFLRQSRMQSSFL